MRSYLSSEELVTTRTRIDHVSWQRRSAKGVVMEVIQNLWGGLCNAVRTRRIATSSESWRYFCLSNETYSPFRRLLNPGRSWTPCQKKTPVNQFCFWNVSVHRPPFLLGMTKAKDAMSLHHRSIRVSVKPLTPGLDSGCLMLSKTWCKLYVKRNKVYSQMQIIPTIFISRVILGFQ